MKDNLQELVIEGIAFPHPEKLMYPKAQVTKGDVAQYYEQVSARMMPYLKDRLISVVGCPEGVGDQCFFRRHPNGHEEGVGVLSVVESTGKKGEYCYVENTQGLISEVYRDTLEFHTWGSKITSLEKPDMMVFDLDPDVDMPLERIRQGVEDLKSILDALQLSSFLKTSGGKGYHIVVPCNPTQKWGYVQSFAKGVAVHMERMWPDRYTSESRKSERSGRIYVDWMRNVRGATSVAPYSLRNREEPTVSMPISWNELATVDPNAILLQEALTRIKSEDPWKDYASIDQELPVA